MKKKQMNILIISILPFLLIIFIRLLNKNFLNSFDIFISESILQLRSPNLNEIMKNISKISNPKTLFVLVLIISAYLFLFTKAKKLAKWYILTAIINMVFVCNIVKFIVRRPRPEIAYRLVEVSSYSFPSGHAFNTIVTYGALVYIILIYLKKYKKNSKLALPLIGLFIALAILVAFSRIYLGVHYLTDVIGGLSLGTFSLLLSIYLYEVKYEK